MDRAGATVSYNIHLHTCIGVSVGGGEGGKTPYFFMKCEKNNGYFHMLLLELLEIYLGSL